MNYLVSLSQIAAVSHVSTDHTATSSSADADDSFADLNPSSPMPILIRATNGKRKGKRKERVKITTIIQPEQLEGFFTRYAETCKAGMQGLKKRDRSGRKKAKAKKRKDTDVEKKA